MQDPPSIHRKPSIPGVIDLGVYADKVCGAAQGWNLIDNLSVLIGAIIAGVHACKLAPEQGATVIQTVVQALPKRFAECQARFASLTEAQLLTVASSHKTQRGASMTTDTTSEVHVLTSKIHPGYVYIGCEPSADKRM